MKQELPVIPKYMAEYLELAKDKIPLMIVLEIASLYKRWSKWTKEYDWISSNDEAFSTAWLSGYEVEEEQKYYARIKGWELFADFVGVQYWGIVSIYGRIGFVSADDAKDNTKDEWKRLGIDDSNAEFVEVV